MSRNNRNRNRGIQVEEVEELQEEEQVVVEEEEQAVEEPVRELDSFPDPTPNRPAPTAEVLKAPVAPHVSVEAPSQPKPIPPTTPTKVSTVSDLEKKLNAYVEGMATNKDAKEVAKVQYGLFRIIRGLLATQDPEEFRKNWNTLLTFANKNRDKAFNEAQMFRGAEAWVTSDLEFTLFRRLCWLILQTADPKTRRENLRTISLNKAVEGLKQTEVNHILNFYG